MKLAVITAHAGADSLSQAVSSWTSRDAPSVLSGGMQSDFSDFHVKPILYQLALPGDRDIPTIAIANGKDGMLPAYQRGFMARKEDFLAFLHDDTIIHDQDWVSRVLAEFEDPTVGLVGFGGGTGHGSPSLYRESYDYHQLARSNFLSNMTDAENHGRRFTGSCDVAVLDGFALIVRREVLEKAGGWPLNTPIGYIAYDYWLSCITRERGYKIRLVGIPCAHLGGHTFVKLGIGEREDHWPQYLAAHRYIYDRFKNVLPFTV